MLTPNGTNGIYGVVEFKNVAVGVLALENDDGGNECVWLVGQYRYPLKRYSWELPEGGCPKGESVLSAAKRELREETGLRARKWSRAFEMDLSNSVTDERAVVFLARDLVAGVPSPDETEVLRLKRVKLKWAVDQVLKGEITDAISVAALLYAAQASLRPSVHRSGKTKK